MDWMNDDASPPPSASCWHGLCGPCGSRRRRRCRWNGCRSGDGVEVEVEGDHHGSDRQRSDRRNDRRSDDDVRRADDRIDCPWSP